MSVVALDGQVCLADPCIGGPPATKSIRVEIGGYIPFAEIVIPTTSNALAHVFFLKGALKVEALLGHDYSPFMFRGWVASKSKGHLLQHVPNGTEVTAVFAVVREVFGESFYELFITKDVGF